MDAAIIVAIISAGASILAAAFTYWFTKLKEREADTRKQKIEHYRELINSMSGIVGTDSSPEGNKHFARACNNLGLIASQEVLTALQEFQDEIRVSNPAPSAEHHDALLAKLILAIRTDIGVSKNDNPESFTFRLWCSGTNT